ncbi:ABC transporter ATP-binding protein [Reyranella soli]|uniref:ATP-binding protein n=1 Tax=Reyranella soli TaxID=1230389 RepID=A0A512NI82_9HYPH|nr:ABC transporter ATP-binding protein [Reyranella soli]GEP58625.1 ATP-binding protein [Reyranella soli]
MIVFENVHKSYPTRLGRKVVLDSVNLVLDTTKNIGILGLNGAGKSTLLRLISGTEFPERGRIRRGVSISFPLGYSGCFAGNMTGRENAAFLARVYGFDVAQVVDFVESFADLGEYFDEPFKTYSSGMGSRLAFGASIALEFDVYLIDEALSAGDARFAARCQAAFQQRLVNSRVIMVSHQTETLLTYCDVGATLHKGKLTYYDDIKQAVACYNDIVNEPMLTN